MAEKNKAKERIWGYTLIIDVIKPAMLRENVS